MKFHWRGASHQDTQPQEQDDRQEAHLRSRRWQTVAALVLTLLLFIALPVYAWFYHRRSMESVAMVNMPVALQIGEGNRNHISYLDLSKIDVEGSEHYKDVVFCVYGREPRSYNLQLAHTTNIGFTYTIYKATKKASGTGQVQVSDSGGTQFTYSDTEEGKLPGSYLNQDTTTKLAKKNYHSITYPSSTEETGYSHVQKNAEPLYWKTSSKVTLTSQENDYYIDYYILHISWDGNLVNNKETDMVYLMAEAVSGSGDQG